MGIAYCLVRTSPDVVEQLRERPKALAKFLYPDDDVYEAPKPRLLAQLFGKRRALDTRPVPARQDGDETDLDKSWHFVHYLLCGDTGRGEGPLALIGQDQHPLADLDLGLGKPNVISAASVRAFSEASAALSDEDFLQRFQPDVMPLNDLYLGQVVQRGEADDIREYALENFHGLRDFVRQAADRDEALITYYC